MWNLYMSVGEVCLLVAIVGICAHVCLVWKEVWFKYTNDKIMFPVKIKHLRMFPDINGWGDLIGGATLGTGALIAVFSAVFILIWPITLVLGIIYCAAYAKRQNNRLKKLSEAKEQDKDDA